MTHEHGSFWHADNPFWRWSQSVVVIVAVAAVLYRNASSFDETERNALSEITVLLLGGTGLQQFLGRHKGGESDSSQ